MSSSVAQAWAEAALHPDPSTDLGYEPRSLTVIHVKQGGEKYMFLPSEEEHLHDDEFIVADPGDVYRLEESR